MKQLAALLTLILTTTLAQAQLADPPKTVTAPISIPRAEWHYERAKEAMYKYQYHILLFKLHKEYAETKDQTLLALITILEAWK